MPARVNGWVPTGVPSAYPMRVTAHPALAFPRGHKQPAEPAEPRIYGDYLESVVRRYGRDAVAAPSFEPGEDFHGWLQRRARECSSGAA